LKTKRRKNHLIVVGEIFLLLFQQKEAFKTC